MYSLRFSHSLFLCGVRLGAALLLDIIQLDFFIVQLCFSNKMALCLGLLILYTVISGLLNGSTGA
jgi:hypothetical protein